MEIVVTLEPDWEIYSLRHTGFDVQMIIVCDAVANAQRPDATQKLHVGRHGLSINEDVTHN